MQTRALAFVLAGGSGTRLHPLTKNRSKPAVPFGGKYRIIDFVLSNLVNSDIRSIYVLTQFKAQSLLQHLRDTWQRASLIRGHFLIPVPAQMHKGPRWFEGTADAVYQNLHLIEQANPEIVVVFGADHIYKMDVREMVKFHQKNWAKGTVAALPITVDQAHQFGTMEVDKDWRIRRFYEKVPDPPEIPGRPGWTLVSMGNYVFEAQVLTSALRKDAHTPDSRHDFGGNILPAMVKEHPIYAYDFSANQVPGQHPENQGYWRDVGTIEAYYEAHMDLRSLSPSLNLYNPHWPIRHSPYEGGPAKSSFNEEGRRGQMINSLMCEGSILAGGQVTDSVIGRGVFVDSGAEISESVVMDGCHIGAGARIHRAILDKNVRVPPDASIGFDTESDRRRYHVSETGIVVLKGPRSPIEISYLGT